MALAFLIDQTDRKLEDDELALGEPDEAEARDLSLHVIKDTKRYRVTTRRLNRIDRKIGLVIGLLLAVLTWQILTSQGFAAFVALFH